MADHKNLPSASIIAPSSRGQVKMKLRDRKSLGDFMSSPAPIGDGGGGGTRTGLGREILAIWPKKKFEDRGWRNSADI